MAKNWKERIRDTREDTDLTQTNIAEVLGIKQTVYSRYERGENALPIAHLISLANFYHTSTDYLLGLTDERRPYPPSKRGGQA